MPNPKLITTPFAETGARNDIPESGASEPQQATMQTGFPQTTSTPISEGGIPPEREDFNGMFHLTTSHLSYLNRGLWYEFDSLFAAKIGGYPLNARLRLDNGDIVQSTIPNNSNNPNSNMSGWIKPTVSAGSVIDDSGLTQQDINNGVKSAEALRLLNPNSEGERIYLTSFNEGQGEGGGVFISKNKGTLVDDGGTILQSSNASIVYVRINFDSLTPEMFGAKGDGITDDSAAFQAYCDSSLTGQSLYLGSKGRYKISKQVDLKGKSIVGAGMGKPSEAYYNLNCIDVDGASPDLLNKTAFINSGPSLLNLTARCSNGSGNNVSFIEIDGYLVNIENITIVNFYNQIVVKEATVGFYVSNWWSYYSQNAGLYCQDPNSRVSTTGMFRNVYFQLGDNYCMIFDKSIVGMNFENITIESMNGGIKCPSIARCKISNFWCENTKDGTAKKVFDFSTSLGSSWGNVVENIITTGTNGSWVDNFSPSKSPSNSDITGVVSTNSMLSVSSAGVTVNNKVTLKSTGLYTDGALYEARLSGATPLVKLRTIGADSTGAAYNASDMYTKTMRKWGTYNHLTSSSGQFVAPMFLTYDQSFTTQQDNAGWTIVKESTGVYRVERKSGNTNVMTNPNIVVGAPIIGSRIGNGSIAMSSLQMIESYSGSWTTATEAAGFKIFWRDSANTLVDPWRFTVSLTLGSGF